MLPESAAALEVVAHIPHLARRHRADPQLAHLEREGARKVAVDAEVAAAGPDAGGRLADLAAVAIQSYGTGGKLQPSLLSPNNLFQL